jgi:hypothetical protein
LHRKRTLVTLLAILAAIALVPVATAFGDSGSPQVTTESATALGTGFTYQGKLTDAGAPANGNYDIRFVLYDSDVAGSAIGNTLLKTNVAVVNGLFSVDLDFGTILITPTATATVSATATGAATVTVTPVATPFVQPVFDGTARWLEIAVRPGGTSGAPTVLSPRQPISPAPYALYAKAAGSLAIPFSASGVTNGGNGVIDITQTSAGVAVAGRRINGDASGIPSILGSNAGSGAAVQGQSTYASPGGIGVQGFSDPAQGTGGRFQGATGIEVDGAIKVSGTNPAAFVHSAAVANIVADYTVIDNPMTNGDPNAILIVTALGTDGSTDLPAVGVFYNTAGGTAAQQNKWAIQLTDHTGTIASGAKFNVLVIKQ